MYTYQKQSYLFILLLGCCCEETGQEWVPRQQRVPSRGLDAQSSSPHSSCEYGWILLRWRSKDFGI